MSLESTSGRPLEDRFKPQEMTFMPYYSLAEGETTIEHDTIMGKLATYLSLVPISAGNEFTEQITPGLRWKIFEEREHSCEACASDLTGQKFDIHHTDYNKGSDPDYLKILCKPCHSIVNVLTGMKWWFAQETGLVAKQDTKGRSSRNKRPLPFWLEPGFEWPPDVDEEPA